jgi:hypothetical protein
MQRAKASLASLSDPVDDDPRAEDDPLGEDDPSLATPGPAELLVQATASSARPAMAMTAAAARAACG